MSFNRIFHTPKHHVTEWRSLILDQPSAVTRRDIEGHARRVHHSTQRSRFRRLWCHPAGSVLPPASDADEFIAARYVERLESSLG